MSYYVGQNVEVVVECEVDGAPMDNAIGATLLVLKPDKTSASWPGAVDNLAGTVTATGALDQVGKWRFQVMVEFAVSGIIPGDPFDLQVLKLIA